MRRLLIIFILLLISIPLHILPAYSGHGRIKQIVRVDSDLWYGISRDRGFLVSSDRGKTWSGRNNGLPVHVVYPFDGNGVIPLTSLGVDPADPDRAAVTASHGLYLTENGGESWTEIKLDYPVRSHAYLTSVALSPFDKNSILLGTSYSGLYATADRGKSWFEHREVVKPFYQELNYTEEISGVAFHPYTPGRAFIAGGFGEGLYDADLTAKTMRKFEFSGTGSAPYIRNISTRRLSSGEETENRWRLDVSADEGTFRFEPAEEKWKKLPPVKLNDSQMSEGKIARLSAASGKFGIYVKSWNAGGESLDTFLQFIEDNGMNSLVVDVKDDFGRITYDTSLELPHSMGAVRDHIKMEELVSKAHEKNIYVIGRIVCFQDPQLYHFDGQKHAVWDSKTEKAWAALKKATDPETEEETYTQREFWVDPFSEFAWNYYISIAAELQGLGIDEVQFDYIRFPSDGDMSNIHYRHQRPGMRRIDALESFLRMAREKITIPISTDLYGFNSWYRMGNWIGQCLEMVSYYVDAVCPMFYPSHFPPAFYEDMNYWDRAQAIYRNGSNRSATIVEGRSIVRPYVQAFLIGGEVKFEKDAYTIYLERQVKGTQESMASGFTLWNNSNRYYMVTRPLKSLLTKAVETEPDPVLD